MNRSVGDSSTTVPTQADTTGSESPIKDVKTFVSAIEMQVNQQMENVKDKAKDINAASVNVPSTRGYNWLVASIIVVADLVGGGLVAMPAAFHDTGMTIGCIFLVLIAIFFTSTAHLLSQAWSIMRDRWPVYKTHCRQPYPEIDLSQYSVLIRRCSVSPLVVLAISLLCTVIAAVLITVGITQDYSLCKPTVVYKPASFYALYSLGTFVFAYSGHHVFPTIQHDMHEPKEFSKSVLLGFFWACCLYIPLSVYAYFVYGQSMQDSLIDSIQTTWIRHGADLAVAFHCVLTIILTINPINQQFEDIFHVPHKMCWQRIVVRTGLLAVIVFVALSIPNFGSIMDFFGSTTIPFTCIILPTLFSLSLKNQRYNEKTKKWKIPTLKEIFERTPRHILIWFLFVNVLTIIASMISAVMAVRAMATIRFVPPCYVQPFLQSTDHSNTTYSSLKCCGQYSNITRNPEIQCFSRISH
uniref:Amino acid transporter transmembrane domain-containing protein n=1 Tax=Onchocerca volvulus TaxID=6282 RepID=A0A8R1U3Z2_ONCVO